MRIPTEAAQRKRVYRALCLTLSERIDQVDWSFARHCSGHTEMRPYGHLDYAPRSLRPRTWQCRLGAVCHACGVAQACPDEAQPMPADLPHAAGANHPGTDAQGEGHWCRADLGDHQGGGDYTQGVD